MLTEYPHLSQNKMDTNKNFVRIGDCVEKDIEVGNVRFCLNLNNTYTDRFDDLWVVQVGVK